MGKLVSIKRELNPEQALSKIKAHTKNKDLELVFCRDYGDLFLMFVRSPGESKTSVAKNAKVINKRTGQISEWRDADLEGKPWTANYDYGERIWGTMR